eukprot:5797632-Pleurochrysis_carterae.AAC.2
MQDVIESSKVCLRSERGAHTANAQAREGKRKRKRARESESERASERASEKESGRGERESE